MKILAVGDLHRRSDRPISRVDDYQAAQDKKLRFILNTAVDKKCDRIIFPGDVYEFFPHKRVSWSMIYDDAKLFQRCPIDIMAVFGQHDASYHNDWKESPLALLGLHWILATNNDVIYPTNSGFFVLINYWKDILSVRVPDADRAVLVCHTMISDKDYWDGQLKYSYAKAFMKKHPFDLIISGDNHHGFIVERKDQLLINCGSVMRINRDQANHKPFCVVVDLETLEYEKVMIPIAPAEDVFVSRAEEKKQHELELDSFFSSLDQKLGSVDPLSFLKQESAKLSDEAKRILEEALKEVE